MRHNESLGAPGDGVPEHTTWSSDPAGAASVSGSSSRNLTVSEMRARKEREWEWERRDDTV